MHVSLRRSPEQSDNVYLLALDAAEEEDLDEGNGSTNGILIKNEEGCIPAMAESLVTWKS
jgi:hypothetical protein